MKILITGSNGLLGQKLVKRCIKLGINFVATSKGENRNLDCPSTNYVNLDITDQEAIEFIFQKEIPTAIIHTAAITNVDHCEIDPELCRKVNVNATQNLFTAAKKIKAHFQLLSTDFVFDGEKGNYSETDSVHPLSVYAQSKVDGEALLIADSYANWSISRTIIVYGTGHGLSRSNLILWAIDALPKGELMKVVDDQFRAPTWADDLAYGCLEIVIRSQTGIFHLSGPETYSIVELVRLTADSMQISAQNLETISSITLNQSAVRPPKTGFNLQKAKDLLDYKPQSFSSTIPLLIKEIEQLKRS